MTPAMGASSTGVPTSIGPMRSGATPGTSPPAAGAPGQGPPAPGAPPPGAAEDAEDLVTGT